MSYAFYTIYTVVDIGDGKTPLIDEGSFTSAMNLNRLVEPIMRVGYPMLVSVQSTIVDLTKDSNSTFYNLPYIWGNCKIYTFKFTINSHDDIHLNGIPLVLSCTTNDIRITKFDFESEFNNSSISKQTF